ncbi:MAG: type VI secretion system tube protein TssD [Janthinobacterium lividum]
MASFSGELRVAGHVFPLLRCDYQATQATDGRGRVAEKVRHHPVTLLLDVPPGTFLEAWAADPHKRYSADVVFLAAAGGRALETLSLKAAYCVHYQEAFATGDATTGSYVCHITLSDPGGFTLHAGGPAGTFVAPAARDYAYVPLAAVLHPNPTPILSKQQRYDARMKKIDAARSHLAANVPEPVAGVPGKFIAAADATRVIPAGGSPRDALSRLQEATERLVRNNVAVERAKLANDAYENGLGRNAAGVLVPIRPNGNEPPEGWVVKQVIENKQSGFMATLYESTFERPPRKVLAFRGTDVGEANDASTDFLQGIGRYTDQYKQTEITALKILNTNPKGFDITGHSLGGGEASLAGLVTNQPTYTFNAAGLHANSMLRAGLDPGDVAHQRQLIQAYYSEHDPLSLAQDHSELVKAGLGTLLPVPVQPFAAPVLNDPRNLPAAVGTRRPFPDAGAHPVPPVVAGIERQKDEDLAIIGRLVPTLKL